MSEKIWIYSVQEVQLKSEAEQALTAAAEEEKEVCINPNILVTTN